MSTVYEKIRDKRIELGWSQEELAKKTGYTDRSSIAKIEAGKIDISTTKIQQFADVLGVTPSWLMGWDDLDADDKLYQLAKEKINLENGFYIDPKTAEVAQAIVENKELSLLFNTAKNASPEDLQIVHGMLLALKRKENHEENN